MHKARNFSLDSWEIYSFSYKVRVELKQFSPPFRLGHHCIFSDKNKRQFYLKNEVCGKFTELDLTELLKMAP